MFKKWLAGLLVAMMVVQPLGVMADTTSVSEDVVIEENIGSNIKIRNPRIYMGKSEWDCIWFGNYLQNDTNGDQKINDKDDKEPIKWRILSVSENKALLLSDKALDVDIYDTNSAIWETSYIRKWLNNFADIAFGNDEKNKILNINNDKVFLLSNDDIYYFNEEENHGYDLNGFINRISKKCKLTNYAKLKVNNYDYYRWWLKCRDTSSSSGESIDESGNYFPFPIRNKSSIRPALYVDLTDFNYYYAGTVTSNYEEDPIYLLSNKNTLLVGDIANTDLNLSIVGKAGTYDPATGVFTAVKKGSAKLYYLDGKKKVVVCTIKIEQPKLKASLKMKTGKTKKLKLSGTKRSDIVWTSSDESVASMSGGIVTAKKAGECDIIAKIGNHEWKCHVTVK